MLLSLLLTGRLNPPFSWARYHPRRASLAELVDVTTISLLGAFIMALVLVLVPGDQIGELIASML